MWIELALFVAGFFFLIKGADILVDGSSVIARRFGVSSFFIGLTVVAFGTSAPELIVSALAGLKGSSGIALGNIIGSNISNTMLILGVAALVTPLTVKRATINKEIPFALLATVAVAALANDNLIDQTGESLLSRIDGIVLVLFFAIFLVYTFGISREKEGLIEKAVDELTEEKEMPLWLSAVMITGGLSGLGLGGKWIVDGATAFAASLGVSEALIGLTIVAIGTSLPELAASVVAARKGDADIAVGNVIGSNIFNLLWVLGLSSVIRPIPFMSGLNVDFGLLLIVTILLLFLIYSGKRNVLARREGAVLLVLYLFYIVYLIIRG